MELLTNLFALVCGQNPGHTWAPGGVLLPCCQRCAGLYFGAGLALVLHLCVRPRLSANFLYVHGGFLLLMVPFGYHWVPQGPVLRTISGFLFGAGIMAFLRTPIAQKRGVNEKNGVRRSGRHQQCRLADRSHRLYAVTLVAGLFCLLRLARFGGAASAAVISLGITWGALGIMASVLASGVLGLTRMGHSVGLDPNPELSPVQPNRTSGADSPPR